MTTLKILSKQAINSLARLFAGNKVGGHVLATFVRQLMDSTIRVKHRNTEMSFSAPNELTQYRVRTFSTKEPDTLVWLDTIPEEAVLWDVGANVGLYSIYAAKKGRVRVFSFEPSVFNLELLARNIYANGLHERITVVPNALSDRSGPSLFKMSTTAWGGALSAFGQDFDQHGNKLSSVFEYQTMGMTMDDAVNLFGVPAPRFIKIDVDGIEHFILRGGAEVLKHVESALIEIDDDFVEQAEESTRHLVSAGLVLKKKFELPSAGNQHNQWWIRKTL